MVSKAKIQKAVEKLALNFGENRWPTDREEIVDTWMKLLKNYTDDDLGIGVKNVIGDVDVNAFPSFNVLRAHMPRKEERRSMACKECFAGVRCNVQDMSDEGNQVEWYSWSYACRCEAGQELSTRLPWPCDPCPALDLDEASRISGFHDYPVCKAHDKRPDQVRCKRWRDKLSEKASQKQGVPLEI